MFMSSRFSTFSHVGDQLVTKPIGVGARDFLGTVGFIRYLPKRSAEDFKSPASPINDVTPDQTWRKIRYLGRSAPRGKCRFCPCVSPVRGQYGDSQNLKDSPLGLWGPREKGQPTVTSDPLLRGSLLLPRSGVVEGVPVAAAIRRRPTQVVEVVELADTCA